MKQLNGEFKGKINTMDWVSRWTTQCRIVAAVALAARLAALHMAIIANAHLRCAIVVDADAVAAGCQPAVSFLG